MPPVEELDNIMFAQLNRAIYTLVFASPTQGVSLRRIAADIVSYVALRFFANQESESINLIGRVEKEWTNAGEMTSDGRGEMTKSRVPA